jgi:hypothetical protein
MSNNTNSTRFLKDFEGRRTTACAIIVACAGSAALNIWGASQIFPSLVTSLIFAGVIGANEVIAALALRSIVKDYENNRYWKARLASIMLVLAVAGCVISGHRAFHTLFLEAEANHEAITVRAEAAQAEANAQHLIVLAATDAKQNGERMRWEAFQNRADDLKLQQLKAEPPHWAIVGVLLALFELVKIGGLYALATPTTRGLTKRQRRAQDRLQKIRDAEAEAKFERDYAAALAREDDNVIDIKRAKA